MKYERLKIVMLLTNPFDPDPRVYKEAKALVNSNFNVTILAWDREELSPQEETIDGIFVHRIRTAGQYGAGLKSVFSFFRFYFHVISWLIKRKRFVLHCHDLDTVAIGILFYFFKSAKFVFDPHEVNYYPTLHKYLRWIILLFEKTGAKLSFTTCYVNLNQFKKLQNFGVKNLIEVRNCPELSFFHHPVEKKPSDMVILGWIGQIKEGKGVEKLFPIGKKLQDANLNVSILLVGRIHPSFEEQFQQLLSDYNDLNIEYIGHFPYNLVGRYYRRLTISLILSDPVEQFLDSTPTKFYESLANGLPVLCTPIGDTKKLIKESEGGITIDFDEVHEIDEIILSLLREPLRLNTMAKKAYLFAKENLYWERMSERLIDCYKNILILP